MRLLGLGALPKNMFLHTDQPPSTSGNSVSFTPPAFSWLIYIGLAWVLASLSICSAENLIPGSSVTLEWDANSEPDVAGYKLHFGPASGSYPETFDAGNLTTATVAVVPGATYYFTVTAYNTEGLESPFSNEVTFTAPQLPELQVEHITPPEGTGLENGIPDVTGTALLPDGSLSFTISAQAGQSIQVEASSDLLSWICRGILENPTGGIIVTDPDAAAYERRFYRVVMVEAAGN